ncbi:MAG: TRAP transporter substrate-binding protein [Lachnospiraceae bacterium]|nr:TRAP transporter substrate-binding protein [Lachnospiraceae bacterium]
MKKRNFVIILTIVAALGLVACGGKVSETASNDTVKAADQVGGKTETTSETVTLKIGNAMAGDHPWNAATEEFIEKAKEYSNGQLVIENYSDATLGTEAELLEQVKTGTLDMCIVDPSVGTTYSKKLQLFALPFLFADKTQWEKALDGQPGQDYARMIEDETGIKIMAYWGGSTRNVISVKAPITDIAGLKGFKLRLAASELKFKVWEAAGCLPVEVAFGETYSALSSGLCDGMENEMPSILSAKFYEVAPYLTKTEHEITVRPVFMNADTFHSLSPELQEAITKAMQETTVVARDLETEYGKKAEDTMVNDFGMQEFDIDKQVIIDAVKSVFDEFGNETGLSDIINMIQKS